MTLAISIKKLRPGIIRVSCASLPGCVGYGATLEEACREMRAAISGYFADLHAVPPSYFGDMPAWPRN